MNNIAQEPQTTGHLVEIRNLTKHYTQPNGLLSSPSGKILAVDGVSFHIDRGETLALVGESGCGKSTTGKSIMRLIAPTSGEILVEGTDIAGLSQRKLVPFRRRLQFIFQDPYSSLNPRMTAGAIVEEPLIVHFKMPAHERRELVAEMFERVGLRAEQMVKYPHEFSGGQRQRIMIAKALTLRPSLIIADEPVSALDVSIQAQVLNLLTDLQRELGISFLFISHDLAVVEYVSHRVAVMYLGKIVELGNTQTIFERPLHPYTETLLSAAPISDPKLRRARRFVLEGDVPSPSNPPKGCKFHTRCPIAKSVCAEAEPELVEVEPGRLAACHFVEAGKPGPLSRS